MKLWNTITIAIAGFFAILGTFIAYTSVFGCFIFLIEEPEMPKSLIK